jgi:hypothetical protein
MMEGITVLSQETDSPLAIIILGVWSALLFAVCLWAAIKDFRDCYSCIPAKAFLGLALISLLIMGICIYEGATYSPETTYKVIIDESVSFQELQERYEIIDQEGQIYTIKEKTK